MSETEHENTEPVDETPAAEVPEPAAEEPTPTETEATESPEPAVEPEAPTAPAARHRPRRHIPRSARRQRPKKVRTRADDQRERAARQPKAERERGRRQERRGVVVSSAMDKTIVVKVDELKLHPRYKKVIRRSHKFHAHDEQNEAKVGDLVRIVETRPLSKTKSWRLAEVVEAAK